MRLATVRTVSMCAFLIGCSVSVSANAETLNVTYSFTGGPTGPPTQVGTTLYLDGMATGSIVSSSYAWNPVTEYTYDVINLTDGINNGTFSMKFADGSTLSGTLYENDSAVIVNGGTGMFTQTLTITGGTDEFAGASGVLTGSGSAAPTSFMSSGAGPLDAPDLPEPLPSALVLCGLVVVGVVFRRRSVGG